MTDPTPPTPVTSPDASAVSTHSAPAAQPDGGRPTADRGAHHRYEHTLAIIELLREQDVAMVTTVTADGRLQARPMAIQKVADDGDMWFFIARGSEQAANIAAHPRLNVAFASEDRWISVSGRGEVIRDSDLIHELWSHAAKSWFPQGPRDPQVGILHVDADAAEYWDSPGGPLASLISLVKTGSTGRRYAGRHTEADMP